VRDAGVLEQLERERRIVLRYVQADGTRSDDLATVPNGSLDAIAGVCDRTGRVLGLMPHPERNITPWHHPQWTRTPGARNEGEGQDFYRRMVAAASQSVAADSVRVPTSS
jgi:phosphoribosylformylglycinamidine synthase